MASDDEALAHREDSEFYFAWWGLYGPMNGDAFPTVEQTPSGTAADQIVPQNADWFVFSYGSNWSAPVDLRQPEFAESPYGYKVVASFTEGTNPKYNRVENVLGHPTMYMEGEWGGPINPYNPAWMENEFFSLISYGDEETVPGEAGGPGYVTIAFDHDVIDDPANPYGIARASFQCNSGRFCPDRLAS